MKEGTFFSDFHERLNSGESSNFGYSRFFAECVIELEENTRFRSVQERGTENKSYNPLAINIVGYDGEMLHSLLLAPSEEEYEKISLRFREYLKKLWRYFHPGKVSQVQEQEILEDFKKTNRKLLAALVLAEIDGGRNETFLFFYPDVFDQSLPIKGPNLALHFVGKASDMIKMN